MLGNYRLTNKDMYVISHFINDTLIIISYDLHYCDAGCSSRVCGVGYVKSECQPRSRSLPYSSTSTPPGPHYFIDIVDIELKR